MKSKIYFAYGSNLNHEQMAYRSPDAVFLGTGFIDGYTMTFKGDRAGVADIIPAENSRVPVGVYCISLADERNLDIYEGYPRLYGKCEISADFGGKVIRVWFIPWLPTSPLKCRQKPILTPFCRGIWTAVLIRRHSLISLRNVDNR